MIGLDDLYGASGGGGGNTGKRGNYNLEVSKAYASAGVFRNDEHAGQDMLAYITRDMASSYLDKYKPLEGQYAQMLTSPEEVNKVVDRASDYQQQSMAGSALNKEHTLGRMGLSDIQSQESKNSDSLSQSASLANTENQTRQYVHDRNMSLISGASPKSGVTAKTLQG